jgi:hypothetical protein
MHVATAEGDSIANHSWGVSLAFPGTDGDHRQTTGPAATGLPPDTTVPINNGYFWNTYIWATLDNSPPGSSWVPRQDIKVTVGGTVWDGTNPGSAGTVGGTQTKANGTDAPQDGFWTSNGPWPNLVAWIDTPGFDPNPFLNMGRKPYNLSVTWSVLSYVELDGQRICSKAWTVTIEWKNGVRTRWDAEVPK